MNTALKRRLISLFLLLVGLTVMFLLDRDYRLELRRENERELRHAASVAREELADSVTGGVRLTEHLHAFLLASDTPDEEAFLQFATGLLQGAPDLRGLYYINGDMRVEYGTPQPQNNVAPGTALDSVPGLARNAQQAIRGRLPVVARSPQAPGGPGVVVHVPLYRQGYFDGLATAVFDLQTWMSEAAESVDTGFQIHFSDQSGRVWGATDLEGPTRSEYVTVGNSFLEIVAGWQNGPPKPTFIFLVIIWGLGSALTLGAMVVVDRFWGRADWLSRAVKERTAELERRERVLQAVSFSAEQFLRGDYWREQIGEVLARLGEATGVSRVYLFENHTTKDGRLVASQRQEWAASGIQTQIDNPQLRSVPYDEAGFARWREILSGGQVVHGLVDTFPPGERAFLRQQAIRSIVVVPLFVGHEWWGFMGFDQCQEDRRWSDAEIEALAAAADILGAAIQRQRSETRLRHSVARAQALVRTAERINERIDSRSVLDAICEEAARVLDVPASAILLPDQEKARFTIAAQVGLPASFTQESASLSFSTFRQITGQAGKPTVIPDAQSMPHAHLRELAKTFEFRTAAVVELVYRQRLVGVLCVITVGERREFKEEDLGLLQGLANQAAQAIANADLFKVTRHLLRRTRRQWRQMQRIMDAVPEGVVLLSASSQILLANPAGREFLSLLGGAQVGDTLRELGGQTLADLIGDMDQGTSWIEVQHDQDGRIFEMTERPLEGKSTAGGCVLVIREVTEERHRQEHMRSRERLATVGQLAAGIAHDFNNIMAIITLYSQTLERNPDFPKRQEYLATMSEQARRAADLITQLLDFSRRTVMDRARMNLLPFLKEVVKLLRRTLPENVLIDLQAEPGPHMVHADPTRLQQAIMNLALNARDAMPDGGKLRISLSKMSLQPGQSTPLPDMASGEWLCLSVADRGTGIDPEHMKHLFEPFFTTKVAGKGTGLGLAQVFGIVKQHDGEIDVDSVPGEGTNVTIYLPVLEEKESVPDEADSRPLGPARQETVLLVEDHDPTRQAVHDTLEILGYEVLVAQSGREALELFGEHEASVDLVLSDMIMPEMGGLALYRTLLERFSQVKMVLMTGYPLEDEGRSLLEQGIVDWLHKPFTPTALGKKLRQALESEEKEYSLAGAD